MTLNQSIYKESSIQGDNYAPPQANFDPELSLQQKIPSLSVPLMKRNCK